MNAFHYFLIVARVDLEGLFWQIICYGKNEITKHFSASHVMHSFFLLNNGDTISLFSWESILSFRWELVSQTLSLASSVSLS